MKDHDRQIPKIAVGTNLHQKKPIIRTGISRKKEPTNKSTMATIREPTQAAQKLSITLKSRESSKYKSPMKKNVSRGSLIQGTHMTTATSGNVRTTEESSVGKNSAAVSKQTICSK